jgi:hypothetical protein
MREVSNQIDVRRFETRSEAIDLSDYHKQRKHSQGRTILNGLFIFVILSLLGGLLGAVATGKAGMVERYIGSTEGLMTVIFLAQGAAAIICFALVVRWLRS